MTTWKESIWPETDNWEKKKRERLYRKPNRGNRFGRTRLSRRVQSLLVPSPFVLDMAGVEVDGTRDPSHLVAPLGSPGSQFKVTPLHFIIAENDRCDSRLGINNVHCHEKKDLVS